MPPYDDADLELVRRFARALDREDYADASACLHADCVYEIHGERHTGRDAIIDSYRGNGEAAKRFDAISYASDVRADDEPGWFVIVFLDRITHADRTHEHRCEQHVRVNRLITRIEHRDLPGEVEALAAFKREVGLRPHTRTDDSGYDETYRRTPAVFGEHPERILVDHEPQIERGFPVLDVGAGQGRNCFHLARRGLSVEALDPSRVGLDAIERIARAEVLPVSTHLGGFETHDGGPYGAVFVFGLIPILTREGIALLARRAAEWLRPAGLLFVTAFTTDDDGFAARARGCELIAPNSFRSPDGGVRTYLEPGELARLFDAFTPIHFREGLGPEHRHGDGPTERHAIAEAVLRAGG